MKSAFYERINCPIHNNEMYYHHVSELYACQNRECKYSQGILKENLDEQPWELFKITESQW